MSYPEFIGPGVSDLASLLASSLAIQSSTASIETDAAAIETSTGNSAISLASIDGDTTAIASSATSTAANTAGIWSDTGDMIDTWRSDTHTDTQMAIEYEHHEVHSGSMFITAARNASLGSGATLAIAFKTPPGNKQAHMVVQWVSKGVASIDIIESATWTAGTGTAVVPTNHNRNSADVSTLLEDRTTGSFDTAGVITDPTGLAGGTVIQIDECFAAKTTEGDSNRGTHEFVLKSDTTYGVRLTSNAAGGAGFLVLNWYEHTDRDP